MNSGKVVAMQQLSLEEAVRILASALNQPAGVALVFGALADVPGVEFEPAAKGRFLHAATPARLQAGDWTFVAQPKGNAIEVGHTVRGVILSRSALSATDAAAKLAPAVLEAARQQGADAFDIAQASIGALGEVLGL
jgi:hypothetical protein